MLAKYPKIVGLADGTIGPIKLVKSLDRGLDNEAFKAAKRVKFLPSEIAGKPVDRSREIQYTFSIY